MHVLVIDDSPTIRKLVELSLRTGDHTVEFARTGREGVDHARRSPPDVILLDYVLPDMKGTDVCRELVMDARSADVPVIVMSGKGAEVRPLFHGLSAVVDFVGKPFTPAEIVERLDGAARRRAPPAPEGARAGRSEVLHDLLSFERMNDAARALYARLRPAFARIPGMMAELGPGPGAGDALARKILTPALVEGLLETLLPTYEAALGAAHGPPDTKPAPREGGGGSRLEGEIGGFAVFDLLRMLDASHTGELALVAGGERTVAYVLAGEIVLVSTDDPARYAAGAAMDLGAVAEEAKGRAEAEQRASNKPLYATLADEGAISSSAATEAVHRRSKSLLIEAVEMPFVRFAWRDRSPLPAFVAARGRRTPLAQIALERHRANGTPVAPALTPDAVFARGELFSQRVQELDLSPEERRVLSVVDGRRTVEDLVRRSHLASVAVIPIVRRLAAIELLRRQAAPRGSAVLERGRKRVLILEPDVEEVVAPLEALLKRRREPLGLVGVEPGADLAEAIKREGPRMAIVNVDAAGPEAVRAARVVRAEPACALVALVALLEAPAPVEEDTLLAAGFDAVLVKPVNYLDLEQVLAG